MNLLNSSVVRTFACTAFVAATLAGPVAEACTRLVYLGTDNQVMTARSMDWKVDIGTNLWILPRGIKRSGEAGANSVKWTSKYGSVVATAYDIATTDGMNDAGLVANLLWFAGADYPARDNSKPGLSISAWAQYFLDNYATVDEAVKAITAEPFLLQTANVPGMELPATLHLALSDATGDSAIIEYIDGKQIIHHSRKYQVMTNEPAYDQQLAMNEYWKGIGGTVVLPGTNRASDRFARASFYVNAIPKTENRVETTASVLGVIRNVSVPYGISTPDQPNISSTRWRTLADQKRKLYYFESALTPNAFWIDLNKIDFSVTTGKVQKLDLGPNQTKTFSGLVNADFKESAPFKFMEIE